MVVTRRGEEVAGASADGTFASLVKAWEPLLGELVLTTSSSEEMIAHTNRWEIQTWPACPNHPWSNTLACLGSTE